MSRRSRHRQQKQQMKDPAVEAASFAEGQARAKHLAAGNPLLDILLPIYGEFDLAVQAIGSIPQAIGGLTEPYRLIVLDNGSPDRPEGTAGPPGSPPPLPARTAREASAMIQSALRPSDLFLRVDKNIGYPGGMNYASQRGFAPLILFTSADVLLKPGAIATLVREMDNPEAGVVAPKLLFPEVNSPHGPPGSIQSAGSAFNIKGRPYHIFIGWRPDNPRVNIRRDSMSAVTGACFITRRSLWKEIGGFFEGYGKGTFEDMEYCFAVRRRGAKVIYTPLAVGYHLVNGSRLNGAGEGFALSDNEQLFRMRNRDLLNWDEWRFW